jgi:hypothetical protein
MSVAPVDLSLPRATRREPRPGVFPAVRPPQPLPTKPWYTRWYLWVPAAVSASAIYLFVLTLLICLILNIRVPGYVVACLFLVCASMCIGSALFVCMGGGYFLSGDRLVKWKPGESPRQNAHGSVAVTWVLPLGMMAVSPAIWLIMLVDYLFALSGEAPPPFDADEHRGLVIMFFIGLVLCLPSLIISYPIPRRYRINGRLRQLCYECGYDLRATPSGKCPECGHDNGPLPGDRETKDPHNT